MAKVGKFYLPDELYYEPEDHLWVKVEGEQVRIGMEQLGQEAAGTIVHMKIAAPKQLLKKTASFGYLEAGKFVGPLRMPVDGWIVAVNQEVLSQPSLVNRDPYGRGWLIVAKPENLADRLQTLLHGVEAVERWLTEKVQDYQERGVLPEEAI